MAVTAMLVGTSELSDDLVYEIDKYIFDNLEYFSSLHERASDISVNSFSSSIPKELLHSGSKRFYNKHIGSNRA